MLARRASFAKSPGRATATLDPCEFVTGGSNEQEDGRVQESGGWMRVRSGPLRADRQSADRSRLSLPGLSTSDRQRVRDQHLDREEVRRGGPPRPAVIQPQRGEREAPPPVLL